MELSRTNPVIDRFSSLEIFFKLKVFFSKVFQFGNIAKESPAVSEKTEDVSKEVDKKEKSISSKFPDKEKSCKRDSNLDYNFANRENELIVRFHNGNKELEYPHTLRVIEYINNKPHEVKFNSLKETTEYIINFYLKRAAHIHSAKLNQPFSNGDCRVDIFIKKPEPLKEQNKKQDWVLFSYGETISKTQEVVKKTQQKRE